MSAALRGPERPPPSTLRVAGLVIGLAVRRLTSRMSITRRKKPSTARRATARKRSAGVLFLVFSILFLFNGMVQSTLLVHRVAVAAERRANLQSELVTRDTMVWVDWAHRCVQAERRHEHEDANWRETLLRAFTRQVRDDGIGDDINAVRRISELMRIFEERGPAGFREARVPSRAVFPSQRGWYGEGDAGEMLIPLGVVGILLAAAVVLNSTASNQDLAKVDFSLEWWFTFPVPARSLLLARLLETAVANPLAWFTVFPFFSVVFWCAGYSWRGVAGGLASTIYIGLLAGSVRIVAETGLRRFFSLRNVARLQAALTLVAAIPLVIAIATMSPQWLTTLDRLGRRLPTWVIVNPLMPIGIAAGGKEAVMAVLGCALFALVITGSATTLGGWMLRDGLTTGAGPHQGHRQPARPVGESRLGALGVVAGKELRFLVRDRRTFVQVFLAPVIILGMQMIMNPRLWRVLATHPRHAGAMAFGLSAIVLATGACTTFAVEVPALWMYFTFPLAIDEVLVRKAAFWGVVASVIAVVTFGVLTSADATAVLNGIPTLVLVLVGVVLYAFIGAGLGVLGTDAFETEPRHRVRGSMVYLFMTLAGLFAHAIYTPSAWAKFAQLVLSALLAYALWQKVRDHAPFLLDPSEAPAPSVAVADGLIVALAFFVLQGLLVLTLGGLDFSPGAALLLAFVGAGLVVGVASLFIFWQSRIPHLWATLGLRTPRRGLLRGVLTGVGAGAVGGLCGRGYLMVVDRFDVLRRLRDDTLSLSHSDTGAGTILWFIALTVVAAPLFEEFIFRAVLFGGFRRSIGPWGAALASALVFAVVHPPIAVVPVFVLGFLAAVVYERSRSLVVPIATHMTYNAIVVGAALWRS